MSTVAILTTGVANVASVAAAFHRLGTEPVTAETPEAVERADRLVVPGVGAFGAAMDRLHGLGLVAPLRKRIEAGRPTLAICLGMQILFESSEESPGCEGLGVASGVVGAFPGGVRSPHFGWNRVHPRPGPGTIEPGHYYFANSFRVAHHPAGWDAAWCEHGGAFLAAVTRGGVLACQFHPELSGTLGQSLIGEWLARSDQW